MSVQACLALKIMAVVAFCFAGTVRGQAAWATPPVSNGLVCWFDAAVGVTHDSNGVIETWKDLSGNDHFATRASGAPVLVEKQLNTKPVIQLRADKGACGFNLDGPFVVEEIFAVVRSPNAMWNKDGCILGRRWARSSSHRLKGGLTAFSGDQYPEAVFKNGKKLKKPFDLAPITDFMIVKIDVNSGDLSRNSYQIGMGDAASCDLDVAEILGYATPLSGNDEAQVGTYLATKYGIASSYAVPTNKSPARAVAPSRDAQKPAIPVALKTVPALSVTNGLACWYDASIGVTTGSNGEIKGWSDRSGNAHHATPGKGAPVLALNQLNAKPMIQFRGNWLALAGTFYAKEHYIVVRSPKPLWSGASGLLGRLKGRGGSYNTCAGDTGFWRDQFPAAVTRNGVVLPGPAFDCSPLTQPMILRLVVNDHTTNTDSYAIGNNDGLASCAFDIAEIIGYENILTPQEEELVGAYLSAKYGITTAYPPLPETPSAAGSGKPVSDIYKGWKYSGSLWLLTTPEGANLPATASEENVPVMVQLNKDWFTFGDAKPNGEDIRFTSNTGAPLAYQIDTWDASAGTAGVWVRIPKIKGNARQDIKIYWGKADAASESSGEAVFNRANGYLSVWHMNDPVKDDAGTLESKDLGSAATSGMIGPARRFAGGKGIDCNQTFSYPFASSPHTTEAWFKAEKLSTSILSWGKGDTVNLRLLSSPNHLAVGSRGSSIHATSVLQKSEWVHVAYTYNGQNGQIYLNGRPDLAGPAADVMSILTPVQMNIGNGFIGDIDEVRVSKWARSADWVKLQFENQKPLQTLVGPLMQSGKAFSVSEKKINLAEGKSLVVVAKAGGAQRVTWSIKDKGAETLVAEGCFNYTLNAGRVTGDQAYTLLFNAFTADGVKTQEIPVTIKEEIPDPVFTLKAPATWDGRETLEVIPQLSNLQALQAKGVAELTMDWTVPALVEHKAVKPGKLILQRSRNSGTLIVTCAVSNGGKAVTQSATIQVTEPKKDVWVQRTPGKDEKPVDGQFFARDDKNEGTLYYNGVLSTAADSVFLKLYADNKLVRTESQRPARSGAGVTAPSSVVETNGKALSSVVGGQGYTPAAGSYAFAMKLKPGLIKYKVEFGTKAGGQETVLQTVDNIVCGDAYIIDGQSNALATDTREKSPPETSEWIRSYGRPAGNAMEVPPGNLWCYPVWKAQKGEKAELGWWGMDLAKRLLASQKVPIFILTAAVGGTRIDQHLRNEADPTDLKTIYGRMLWRIQQAKLTHGIRGILWHQGESDQGTDGPSGGYGWETYQEQFLDMSATWMHDFPNVQHYYIYQIWPNSCSMGNGHGDMLREKLRTLPQFYSNMGIMTTHGIRPPGPCHFPLVGWSEFARLILPLMERDFYGKVPTVSITPPNLKSAAFDTVAKNAITLEFDQPVVWSDTLTGQFYLDDEKDKVASGSVAGNVLTLKLKAPSTAKKITYLKEMSWSQETLLNGANGIAALTFCNVPLEK